MTAALDDVIARNAKADQSAEAKAAAELVRLAKKQGLSLTGPDGLLKQLTKTVLETALNEEMTEHLGYEKHDPAGAGSGNIRNGTHSQLKQRLRPMRGLRTDQTAQVIIAGHAFMQNLRRGHYELAVDAPPGTRVAATFTEIARAV